MARRIGKVWVAVEADTKMFRAEAIAGVKKALAGIEGKIPVTADTAQARTQVAALKARMTDLNRQLAEVKIGANGKPAEAAIRKLQLQLKSIADTVASITMKADTSRLDAQIAKEIAQLRKLQEQASKLKLDANAKALVSKIADLELLAEHLDERLGNLDIDIESTAVAATIAKIRSVEAELAVLNARARRITMTAEATALKKQIITSIALIEKLKQEAADLKLGGNVDLVALAAAEGRLLGLEEAVKKLNPEVEVMNKKMITGFRGFGRFGIGVLGAQVALFGGLSAVAGWHIALDGIVEVLAVLVPALVTAAVGLAAWAAAGSDAARAVYNRIKNIHVVSDAMNATIPPMTANLEKMHNVVRPQVWQLYGDAIAIAHSHTGLFNKLAVQTGDVVDRMAARITVMLRSGGTGLSNFFASGKRDLAEFARIGASLGDAFAKLVKVTEQTHIAEFLLNIVGAAAKLFDVFTKIPVPILALVIGLHGIYLWSGLAASGIMALLRPFGRLASAAAGARLAGTAVEDLAAAGGSTRFKRLGAVLRDLGTNLRALPTRAKEAAIWVWKFATTPWGAFAIGVVALIGLGIWLSRTKSRAQEMVMSIEQLVSAATTLNVINAIGAGLIQTNRGLAAAQKDMNTQLKQGTILAPAMAARFGPLGSGAQEAADRVTALTGEHVKLAGELTMVTGRLSGITKAFGTDGLSGAMALAALAGVKVDDFLTNDSKKWAAALERINGVVQGYRAMGVGATQLGNAINVLTISQSDELKNMQTLNAAYDQFTKIVSGPVTGFLTFANTLKRFGNDASVAGAKMTGLGSGFIKVSKKMTDASLQLQSDFQDTFNAATQMADAMRLTGTASQTQVSAIKDIVQVMIPMAGSSKAAAAEISALAQEAGGPGTTNLKELAKWAGQTADPLGAAQKAAADAAISFSNMSIDAQKLGTSLSQDLTKDMATAVENAVGLQGAMNTFAKDIANAGTSIVKTGQDRQTLITDLAMVRIKGKDADAIIKAISDRLGGNAAEIKATEAKRKDLLADVKAISEMGVPAARDLQRLTEKVRDHGAKSDAAKGARAKLIKDLEDSGINARTATGLVDGYIRKLQGVPKNVNTHINTFASGSGTISTVIKGITAPGLVGTPSGTSLTFKAAGGRIGGHGGPRADDQLIAASTGEFMINAASARKLGLPLLSRLNRYAGGGAIGPDPSRPERWVTGQSANFETAVDATYMKAAIAQYKKAAAASAPGPASAGGHVHWVPGAGVNQWRLTTLSALSMLGLSPGLVLDVLYQMLTESGGNPTAVNRTDSNWIAGHPSVGLMQVIHGTYAKWGAPRWGYPGPVQYGVSENPMANIYAALNYAKHGRGFGTGPGQVGSGHGYAAGGPIGFAAGGPFSTVAAFRARLANRQAGERAKFFGLEHSFAIGPRKHLTKLTVQELATLARRQAAETAAYSHLAGTGFTKSNLGRFGAAVSGVDRVARDQALNRPASAGGHPLFAHDLRGFLHDLTVLSGRKIPPGSLTGGGGGGTGGPPLPTVTHVYGGDVGNKIGQFLSSVMAPFARGGMVKSFDRGGWLSPGLTMAYNGTGRNERVSSAGDTNVTLLVDTASGTAADQFLAMMIKKYVKVRGGNVERAYGSH